MGQTPPGTGTYAPPPNAPALQPGMMGYSAPATQPGAPGEWSGPMMGATPEPQPPVWAPAPMWGTAPLTAQAVQQPPLSGPGISAVTSGLTALESSRAADTSGFAAPLGADAANALQAGMAPPAVAPPLGADAAQAAQTGLTYGTPPPNLNPFGTGIPQPHVIRDPNNPIYGDNQQLGLEDLQRLNDLWTAGQISEKEFMDTALYLAELGQYYNPQGSAGYDAAFANAETWRRAHETWMAAQQAPQEPGEGEPPAGGAAKPPAAPTRAELTRLAQEHLNRGGSLLNQPYTGPLGPSPFGEGPDVIHYGNNAQGLPHLIGPGMNRVMYDAQNANTQRALQNSFAAGRGGFLLPEDFVHDVGT